jgi:hypothetical protein
VAPPDDDDAFDPSPTEILPDAVGASAFDPQATEQLGAPGPKPFDDSEAPTDAIGIGGSDDTATGEGPTAPELKGRPPAREEAATALIPGHALGLDGQPALDDLSSSKFLGGAPDAVADPFGAPVDELSTPGRPGGPSPITDDKERADTPYDPTGHWEGVPLAKPIEPTDETRSPAADRPRSRAGCIALVIALGLVAIGGGVAGWWLLRHAPGPVVAEVPPPEPEPVAPTPEPAPVAPPAEPDADVVDEEPDDEPDTVDEDRRRKRNKRKRRRARRKRQPRGEEAVAVAPAAGATTMSVGTLKDVSGAGITSLRSILTKTLKRKLKGLRGVHLVGARPSEGFVIDAWVQSVRKKKVDGGNMVEVSCSAALSEQPGGGVKFNTRATTGVGVSEALTRALIEELARDALIRCVEEMAADIGRYGARKSR